MTSDVGVCMTTVPNVETTIRLNRFVPRDYQLPILDAIENKGYKKVLAILPRRAGKDMTAFQLCIRACLKKVCVIFYIFPTYASGKKILWDSITSTGERILDYIPEELIDSKNGQEMKIRFKNGSLFQIVGSDNYDSLMGTNPQGVVFSEYALQDERAYQYIRPILTANLGWALFISTPRGKNHMWQLYQIALHSPEWFVYKLTVEDTNHIPLAEIEKERREGIMSEDLIQQEYYTSFTMGVEGSYYAKYIDRMRVKNQIGMVAWEPGFKVHTAWDLGVRDSTCIIFFQVIGQAIRLIDVYEKSKEGLEHYAKILQQKPYTYGKHIAPHDIRVREFGSGMTRLEKAKQLGISFTIAPDVSIEDGIESVRSALSKIWIDEKACDPLIKALENYRQEYDIKRKVYKSCPLHDWSSHFADAMRYLCISLPKTKDGTSPDELDRRYREALYGSETNLPRMFNDEMY
jgi:phage terminase large subunit